MLENQYQRSSDKLSNILRQLIDDIANTPEGQDGLQHIYHKALVSLKKATGVERASILLFDPDGVMRFKAWLGLSDKYRKAVEGHTPWNREDVNPASIVTYDIFTDKELVPYYSVFSNEDIRGLAFIPLLYQTKVIGKFMLYSRVPYHFKMEIESAVTISHLVAYAVVRRKIEDKLKLSEMRLEEALAKEVQARAEAEKSVVQRDDFISIASHELKSPLTPILMNFQLTKRFLEKSSSDNPQIDFILKVLNKMEQQFGRYLRLVENLLDVSRITADRLVLQKEKFSLSKMLRDLIDRHEAEFKNFNYKVNAEIPDDDITVFCDKVRIEQVLSNLISNAIKYGMGNPLQFSLSETVNENAIKCAKIVVKDHGIGISEENQKKIFNRFERAANLINYGGLGLGLYISRNIVRAHNGELFFKSKDGVGSTFTLELPIELGVDPGHELG